jgi:alpha,alpha-trehalose phosphorylase
LTSRLDVEVGFAGRRYRRAVLRREIAVPPEHLFPADEWRVIEARWTPEFAPRAETAFALANGFLGVRGTYEEGRPSTAPGVFVNGFHETWPIAYAEDAYGLARLGQTIVNVPDASVIELHVDDEPFFLPASRTLEYARVLDMRNGILTRDLLWATPSGKHVRVRTTRLVSLEHRHVIAMSYEVTVDRPAPVVLRSRVLRWSQPAPPDARPADDVVDPRVVTRLGRRVLDPQVVEERGWRLLLGYRTLSSSMTLGIGVEHVVEVAGPYDVTTTADPDQSEFVVAVAAQPDEPLRLVKYATYQSSRSIAPRELVERCATTLARVAPRGIGALVAEQRACLDRFWDRADVVVHDTARHPVRVQQAVRWNIFHLAQATWCAEGVGVPAKGLTGAAYDGHYFWDTETWVLPFLAYTQPRIARNLLRFRHSMLPKARERARVLGQRGALFPWRTINGDEASAFFQAGTAQYHINADIAYAIGRYLDVRGDDDFLVEVGAEMLVETARMWADLGFVADDGMFHIHGVTGPDEYSALVDDNAYTNLMARLNLRAAAAALRTLRQERPREHEVLCAALGLAPSEPDAWEEAAEQMYVPHDAARGITAQDATFLTHRRWDLEATPREKFPLLAHHHPLTYYRRQVLKQADVVMAMFLVGDEFSLEQKRRNFEYYDPITTGDSSLSASIQSIVASEIGDEGAACRYFDFALLMDLADVAGNASDGVHIASAAGVWMDLVFGFGGVRDFGGVLTIDPRLPRRFDALQYSLWFQGRQIRVRLTHDAEQYVLEEGDPLDVVIRGEPRQLVVDTSLDLVLDQRPPHHESSDTSTSM